MASLIQRGSIYYIQYCVSGKALRVSTGTEQLQIAEEKLRQFESAQLRGEDIRPTSRHGRRNWCWSRRKCCAETGVMHPFDDLFWPLGSPRLCLFGHTPSGALAMANRNCYGRPQHLLMNEVTTIYGSLEL